MLNEELFDTPKDAEIARLKLCIQRYKEHDKKRTEYYRQVCKELQWYKEELDIYTKNDDKAKRIKEQRAQISSLETKIAMNKMKDFSPEEIDKYKLYQENVRLKLQLAKEKSGAERLRNDVKELIAKNLKYEREKENQN